MAICLAWDASTTAAHFHCACVVFVALLLLPYLNLCRGSAVRDYPVSADEYELLEEAGRGVSATVSPF